MTYTQLVQAIKDFAVDAETTFYSHIDEFIVATEHRIITDCNLPLASRVAAPALTIGVNTFAAPADFLSPESLAIVVSGATQYLLSKDVDFLETAYPVAATTGTPRYYAMKDATTIQLAPAPVAAYTTQLRYFGWPESITVAAGGTTWLGDNYSFALQYGALRDAAVYLKEEADVVAMYNSSYTEALGQVKAFGDMRSRTDTYRRKG